MKLVSFVDSASASLPDMPFNLWPSDSLKRVRIGAVIDEDTLLDLQAAWPLLQSSQPPPASMLEVIQSNEIHLPAIQRLIELVKDQKFTSDCLKKIDRVTLLSPLPHPPSVRDGYAFRQHVEAARRNRGVPMIPEFDHFPIFYFTNSMAITGPGPVVVQRQAQQQLDFELEVAVVIGKAGKNIPASRADEYILGYVIMNDWSARTLQMEEMKLNLGPAKGKDFATSLGPWLVTRDELEKHQVKSSSGERYDLAMRTWVNGRLLSEGNLKDMTWTFAQIIERVRYGVWLQPGEVIGSGTVGTGCLLELNGSKITDNLWLKPGDEVKMHVDGLGILINTIVDGGT